eukprot:365050-Chlamydomonas_euryale.AAC.2
MGLVKYGCMPLGCLQHIPIVATAVGCHATTVERKLQEPYVKRLDNSRNARVRVAEVGLAAAGLTVGIRPPLSHGNP